MKPLMVLLNIHIAGESLISLSGVFAILQLSKFKFCIKDTSQECCSSNTNLSSQINIQECLR